MGTRRGWIAIAAIAAASCCLGPLAASAVALPPQGGLTQLSPPNDCIQDFAGTCGRTNGVGMDFLQEVAVSPDGKNAYATAFVDDSVAEFSINSAGGIEQLADPNECISDDADGPGGNPPTQPACQAGAGLKSPRGIAISPDGLTVYVASDGEHAISAFARDPSTGILAQLPDPYECLSDDGDGPGVINQPFDLACGSGIGLENATDVTVSADGANVYVASFSQSVAAFARDTTVAGAPRGSLTQLSGSDACITQVGFNTSCTAVNPGQAIGHGLMSPSGIDVTDDGDNVYVTGFNGDSIAAFTRSPDGSLDQLADPNDCWSDDPDGPGGNAPTDTNCAGRFALNGATGLDVAPDGDAVYVASVFSDAVDAFSRDETTGALAPLADPNDCLSFDSDFVGPTASNGATLPTDTHCASASGLNGATGVTVAPDNKSVYVASATSQGAIAAFSRNQSTEELDQLNEPDDCLGSSTTNCAEISNMFGTRAVAVSPSGAELYALAPGGGALLAFSRELPPTCNNAAWSVIQNTPTTIPLGCLDPNGDPLDRSILALPTHGSLSGNPDTGTVTYTPASGYLGPDSFIFNAQDTPAPGQPSNIATISLNVAATPPPPPADVTPPETAINSHPKSKTRKRRATFTFASSEPGSSFLCSFDGKAFAACTSPFTTPKLKKGKHRFDVLATDSAGNRDQSAATFFWKVKKRRRH